MKRSLKSDKIARIAYSKFYVSHLLNKFLSIEMQLVILKKDTNIFRITSKTKIKNKCILSGRSKAIYKFFKLSRIKLKEEISIGNIEGVGKATW